MNQHEFVTVKDSHDKKREDGLNSSLDRKLRQLRTKGRRVLGFRRNGSQWTIKLMKGDK